MNEKMWNEDDISDFMSEFNSSDFNPGMKQGVMRDVAIEKLELPPQCGKHEVDLLVDEKENEFYCPVC